MKITIHYESIDGVHKVYPFKSLAKARAKAVYLVGENADQGRFYAVSSDGVGKVTVDGASIAEIFADPNRAPTDDELFEQAMKAERAAERAQTAADAAAYAAEAAAFYKVPRDEGCRCSDQQLTQVGCDCPAQADAFAVVESYLVPDEYGGERGARRTARTCGSLAEAETACRLLNAKVEDGEDRDYRVAYRLDDRWHDDYGHPTPRKRAQAQADALDDMPF